LISFVAGNFIEAEAADVVEVQQSAKPVLLADGAAEWSVHTFICVIKKERRQQVYVAVHHGERQASLIYIVEPEKAGTETAQKRAQDLMRAMGASMEEVKLAYSPAMREVLLRKIPVLAPHETVEKILRESETARSEWRRLVSEQAAQEQSFASAGELGLAEWAQRKQELEAMAEAANSAAEHLAAEERLAQSMSALKKVVDACLGQLNAEETAAATERASTAAKAAENKESTLLRAKLAQAEKALKAAAERQKASEKARVAADKRRTELEEMHLRQQEEIKAQTAACAQLAQEKLQAEQQILALRKKQQQMESEAAKAQKTAGEKKTEEQLAAMKKELAAVRAELAASIAERMQQDAAKSTAEMAAQAPTKVSDANAETEQRLLKLETVLRKAEDHAAFLRAEVDRLVTAKTLSEQHIAELKAGDAPTKASSIPADKEPPARTDATPPPHVVRQPPPPGAIFQVDWDLSGVESPLEEVCEVHQAMNRVRLSMEGYPDQSCAAYLLVTRQGGEKRIHIAFHLIASKRVLVYVPVKKAENPAAFSKLAKEAHKFVQVVGIELEALPLDNDLAKRAKALERIPVLIAAPKTAGNF